MSSNTDISKGFTLVELAIVMTIIGLLIGGILKGQELLENSRVTSTIAQVKSYDAATTAFRDIYSGLPGDLMDAGKRIPDCTDACTPAVTTDGEGTAGDQWVGSLHWVGGNLGGDAQVTETKTTPDNVGDETYLFWLHLLKANLIAGITDAAMTTAGTPIQWGITNPSGKIGGGFLAGQIGEDPIADGNTFNGLGVFLLKETGNVGLNVGEGVTTPARAAQIDRKMDDGRPMTGSVMAIGQASSDRCFNNANPDHINEYNESLSQKNCSLALKIQQ